MKKLLLGLSIILASAPSYAVTGFCASGCTPYTAGLTELITLDASYITSGGVNYSGFAEGEYDALNMTEYFYRDGMGNYDGSVSAAPNAMTVNAIKQLKVIVDGKYNQPTGTTSQYIRGDGSLATFPSAPTVNNNVSRTLNSNYTISTTQHARVSYSVNVSWTIQALLSGSGAAFLEYSTNSGSTWITVNQVSKNIGLLTFAGADDLNLVGEIPANALVRIRTTATNMTVTYTRGQEVLS